MPTTPAVRHVTGSRDLSGERGALRPVRPIATPVPARTDPLAAGTSHGASGPLPWPLRAPRRGDVRRWALWRAPWRVIVGVLLVDLAAVVLLATLARAEPVDAADWRLLAILVLGCAVHIEVTRGIERRREVVAESQPYIELKSMWSFAGLLLLPIGPALGLVVFTFAYWWLRVSRRPPHRWTYSAATVVIASVAAWGVLDAISGSTPGGTPGGIPVLAGATGVVAVVVAGLVRWAVNHGLVVAMISLSAPGTPWLQRLGDPTDTLIGMGALALGAALAVLAGTAPWLVPLLLLPVMGMHRGFLLKQFVRAARTDAKTGLLNADAWRDRAESELARLRRRGGELGVVIIDIDAFKGINDRYGHLAGDTVLHAVAQTLRAAVRPYDVVGRFGGEEFVVLVAEAGPEQAGRTAERLRRRISESEIEVPLAFGGGTVRGLTASIGVSTFPHTGRDLDGLLVSADRALYAAKDGGRNRVECAPPA